MSRRFRGWDDVAVQLRDRAAESTTDNRKVGHLNSGQRATLRAIADRIPQNGVIVADEVGMGKTRIAAEVARAVTNAGGRVGILIPPGLGFQWQSELSQVGLDGLPDVIRSLRAYLKEWGNPTALEHNQSNWIDAPVLLVSHAFAVWRFGRSSPDRRWTLLPELYAAWRQRRRNRLPRGYHQNEYLGDQTIVAAANSIVRFAEVDEDHSLRDWLDGLLDSQDCRWPDCVDPEQYLDGLRPRDHLERAIGAGLGPFDLVILDEAHKSRNEESALSRLLDRVVFDARDSRRLALSATPVELEISQWRDMFDRIRVPAAEKAPLNDAILKYSAAVSELRDQWRTSHEVRTRFREAAEDFQLRLSPFLLRRDKREDPDIERFQRLTRNSMDSYRNVREKQISPQDVPTSWRKAICAAESLSHVARAENDPLAQRLRLTLASGHGLAAVLDGVVCCEDEDAEIQAASQKASAEPNIDEGPERRRLERAQWWLRVMQNTFDERQSALYEHPGILATTELIESELRSKPGEKILVFGRFTKPLQTLVQLLNAREMLRRLDHDQPWPHERVHGERGGGARGDWPAVEAAHAQCGCRIPLDRLDEELNRRYQRVSRQRETTRQRLLEQLDQGWDELGPVGSWGQRLCTFLREGSGARGHSSPLNALVRALEELEGNVLEVPPDRLARACLDLFRALDDDDEPSPNPEEDEEVSVERWDRIARQLITDFSGPSAGFAKIMWGQTKAQSRRALQTAFNRSQSSLKVLVAQSQVGREGLNLHRACRTVVLMHPEWNPGVVEQQIGRVDRLDSCWCESLRRYELQAASADPPRIDVYGIVFKGTYDEYNWSVLRRRWDELRAQLHGIVIPAEQLKESPELRMLAEQLSDQAPHFSPTRRTRPDHL